MGAHHDDGDRRAMALLYWVFVGSAATAALMVMGSMALGPAGTIAGWLLGGMLTAVALLDG